MNEVKTNSNLISIEIFYVWHVQCIFNYHSYSNYIVNMINILYILVRKTHLLYDILYFVLCCSCFNRQCAYPCVENMPGMPMFTISLTLPCMFACCRVFFVCFIIDNSSTLPQNVITFHFILHRLVFSYKYFHTRPTSFIWFIEKLYA